MPGLPAPAGAAAAAGAAVTAPTFMHNVPLAYLTVVQRGVDIAIRGLEEDITAVAPGDEVKMRVVEAYPPESFFDPELSALPSVYRDLRTWLGNRGATLGTHPTRRIIHVVAEPLYEDAADQTLVHDLAKMVVDKRTGRQQMPAGVGAAGGGIQGHAPPAYIV